MKIRKASVSHDEAIVRELRADPELAVEYLKAAMADEQEPAVLLIALRHIAEAYGMAKVARKSGLAREALYRALSPKGNPTIKTLNAVLKATGLQLTVNKAA